MTKLKDFGNKPRYLGKMIERTKSVLKLRMTWKHTPSMLNQSLEELCPSVTREG